MKGIIVAEKDSQRSWIGEKEVYNIVRFLHDKWSITVFFMVDCEKLKICILNTRTAMGKKKIKQWRIAQKPRVETK